MYNNNNHKRVDLKIQHNYHNNNHNNNLRQAVLEIQLTKMLESKEINEI